MGRIRTIKPEFPQSETTGRLSRDARLLFIQLWTLADDSGRARASSRMLASLLYPYDEDANSLMEGWLEELSEQGCIRRYEVDGDTYLEIINWLKHQKIDRPSKPKFPAFDEHSRAFDEHSSGDQGPRTKDQGPISRSSERECDQPNGGPSEPPVCDDWPKDYREQFWNRYPRKVGKSAAVRKLDRVRKDGVNFGKLISAVQRIPTRDPKFIPHPLTWLNQGRWDDEPTRASGGGSGIEGVL